MSTLPYLGLTNSEVEESRKSTGKNTVKKFRRHGWLILLEAVKEPMLLLLVAVSIIYFITGDFQEGIIMLFAIVMVAAISVYQQMRSEKAVNALAKLSQTLAVVIREGITRSLPSEELVLGDILIISEGEQVPADAIILQQNDLSVNESLLTGESFPVNKNQSFDQLYSGTSIVAGSAYARVNAIGNNTRVGQLGILMHEQEKVKTPLQQQINSFVNRMALFGILCFAFVFIYNYFESRDWLHALMHGLTLAMAVLPEEIPVALSTFMALGAYRMLKNNVLVKQPETVEALGAATVICLDKTGTITENKMAVEEIYNFKTKKTNLFNNDLYSDENHQLLLMARLASESIPFDPMEKAIHKAFDKTGLMIDEYQVIKEYPLSGLHPFMTHVYKDRLGKTIVACKGAPEGILANANLSNEEKLKIESQLKEMAMKGNRVLAIANVIEPFEELPDSQTTFQWDFLGLLALHDPPKKNIQSVIENFHKAGINVKMITGDYPETASSIAKLIHLENADEAISGSVIETLSDDELQAIVKRINVYARITPEMKLRIINALKNRKEVVAMTGDGVNDAPALKAAHIGIAMGTTGSEVARQAASLVLINDDLSNMVSAVAQGRKIYINLKKAIQYIISIHIPLLSIVTLPLILGWKYQNIFLPLHIIFFELVMGPTCSIAFENEPMEKSLITNKPRKFSTNFFTWNELSISIFQGLIITAALLVIEYYAIHSNLTESTTRTMVFSTLIFANIFLTMTGRSKNKTVFETIRYKNHLVPIIISITLILLALALYYQPLRLIFDFSYISLQQILICAIAAFASVLWVDLYKISGAK